MSSVTGTRLPLAGSLNLVPRLQFSKFERDIQHVHEFVDLDRFGEVTEKARSMPISMSRGIALALNATTGYGGRPAFAVTRAPDAVMPAGDSGGPFGLGLRSLFLGLRTLQAFRTAVSFAA